MEVLVGFGVVDIPDTRELESKGEFLTTDDCDPHLLTSEQMGLDDLCGQSCQSTTNDESEVLDLVDLRGDVVDDWEGGDRLQVGHSRHGRMLARTEEGDDGIERPC